MSANGPEAWGAAVRAFACVDQPELIWAVDLALMSLQPAKELATLTTIPGSRIDIAWVAGGGMIVIVWESFLPDLTTNTIMDIAQKCGVPITRLA